MRLTLRTLLAYLDDILDPADKEELSQKIESSDFAKDLVHQTRDSMRRLRLSAPQVVGTGMGMDPNSVAEYLDNVLPPEQVGDYERICLESPLHLAETAACHHVLTMVLGEPADVDPRARQRMYMIPGEARERRRVRVEPAHANTRGAAAAPMAPTAVVPRSLETTMVTEIPEYLRARPWWRSRGVLAALAAVLIVGVGFFFLSGMAGWFGAKDDVASVMPVDIDAPALPAESPNEESKNDLAATEPAQPAVTTDASPADSAPAAGATSTTGDRYPTAGTNTQPLAPPPALAMPELGASPEAKTQPADQANSNSANAVNDAPPAAAAPADAGNAANAAPAPAVPLAANPPMAANGATSNTTPATGIESPPPATPNVAPPAAIPPQDVPPNSAPPSTAATEPVTAGAAPLSTSPEASQVAIASPAAAAGAATATEAGNNSGEEANVSNVPKGPPELGTYLSGKTVLLKYDDKNGGWFRVQPRSAVVAGERLLALPEFRPTLTLESGVHVDLSGGTQIVVEPAAQGLGAGAPAGGAESPTIEVLYGRVIFTNTSNADNVVHLKMGSAVGEAKLAQNATLAVEVEHQFVPGNDPRKTPAPIAVRMFVPSGAVTWKDASGEIAVDKPSRWSVVEGSKPEAVADSAPPEWIDQEPVLHLSEQKYGAPVIESTLVSDRPVDVQLLELFKGPDRREVKSLVTRSGIHVGVYAPFIDALRDADQKWPTWKTHIETLRSAMAQGPEAAEAVFQALVEQRGRPIAGDLYEMLCGYSAEQIGTTPDQVKSGALARLIDWLEKDSLDYRVLAVNDLWEITGKQLMPNPAASLNTRKINVRNWRNRLEGGELVPVKKDG
jgi:hypothetical protein